MGYRFINYPVYYTAQHYQVVVDRLVSRFQKEGSVQAIYHLGNVKAPGISDLDILVVFKDKAVFPSNPIERLDKMESYFFAHNLFGLSESLVEPFMRYQPHFSGKLIFGSGPELDQQHKTEATSVLWEQIAIEYLVKNFLVTKLQYLSGIVKLRSLLLEANATLYDLDILHEQGPLRSLVTQLINWRKNWFDQEPSSETLSSFFDEYLSEQEKFLERIFRDRVMYSVSKSGIDLSGQLKIITGDSFRISTERGFLRGVIQNMTNLKMARLIQKVQKVTLYLPVEQCEAGSILSERFRFIKGAVNYNKEYLYYFAPPVSVIPFYR
jgi:hypothetical protein